MIIDYAEVIDRHAIKVEFDSETPQSINIVELEGCDCLCVDPTKIPKLIEALKACYDEWKATLKFEAADKLFEDCAVIAPILF